MIPTTRSNLLRARAEEVPKHGYRFLQNGVLAESVNYDALNQAARGIAARLQEAGVTNGAPVFLLFRPACEFVRAFFGCLYAGAWRFPSFRRIPRDSIARCLGSAPSLVTARRKSFSPRA